MENALERAWRTFERTWGSQPAVIASSPGRVNLIGEHTDYNDGFVLPMAIDRRTAVAVGAGTKNSGLHLVSAEKDGTVAAAGPPWEPNQVPWANYIIGVLSQLTRRFDGLEREAGGLALAVASDVPLGTGLSSSAALEAATGTALLSYFGLTMSPAELAKVCQQAEHEFAGVHCGIMDQMSSVLGNIIMLDCRSLETKSADLPEDVRVVILDSGIPRGLSSSAYNERREQCEQGVEKMKARYPDIHALRDVTAEMLEDSASLLSDTVYRRCRHVVTENTRVVRTAALLDERDMDGVGELLLESHGSMRDDYEISLPEMDTLVAIAAAADGCYGARLTGAGFGGAAVALVDARSADKVARDVMKEYGNRTGKQGRALHASPEPGARVDRRPG